jgi:hypothetical protein
MAWSRCLTSCSAWLSHLSRSSQTREAIGRRLAPADLPLIQVNDDLRRGQQRGKLGK